MNINQHRINILLERIEDSKRIQQIEQLIIDKHVQDLIQLGHYHNKASEAERTEAIKELSEHLTRLRNK